ncbi:MAG: DNA/RNA nuclease SfsA [endosymbiont of Galathealinum brachiosum]|uniref:Sugar fermentation stimulation protein homolog n=1 Tax=endosymbiont of Galathealinum brachiosum TaxID=2200906 RepID=A0A370DMI2_9GAMM|nr:MAG: DNA/RNA nuclease SfsA [endosymbiont of Galathealinum brachiosum]
MKFDSTLIRGKLIKRYKRFLADIILEDGSEITAHCANTGAMTGCMPEGANVWLSVSDNPKRKYAHSWQLVELKPDVLACINTGLTNKLAREALMQNQITELAGFDHCRSEVPYGDEGSRVDFVLDFKQEQVFVEVKHVTLCQEAGLGSFPDAVTKRGQKHLRELIQQVKSGDRAVLLFIIMRTDVNLVTPADNIDAEYGRLLREAVKEGVEVIAYGAKIDPMGLSIDRAVPVLL